MKSKLSLAGIFLAVVAGGFALDITSRSPSYSDQLSELIHMRDAGLISKEEYWSVKKQLIRVMRH